MKVMFLLVACFFAVQAQSNQANEKPLYDNIANRLGLMKEVALYKHMNQKPVEDQTREAEILKKMHAKAKGYQLNADKMLVFMTKQMSVAKSIQYRYRADFLSEKLDANPRDLENIRSDISSITSKIYDDLSKICQKDGFSKGTQSRILFDSMVNIEYVKSNEKKALFDSIVDVCD